MPITRDSDGGLKDDVNAQTDTEADNLSVAAKAGLMPLHKWLPAAMVAPTPVSALLHAVAVVKSGVFCIIKFCFYAFCTQNFASMPENILTYIAGCTVLTASIIACQKTQLKEVLAYSTISQLSYMVMTAGMLTNNSVKAALAYMFVLCIYLQSLALYFFFF